MERRTSKAVTRKPRRVVLGWQPIETAPKDGTPILACIAEYGTAVGSFVLHPSEQPITVYFGNYHPNSPGRGEWRDGNGHRRPYMTHWMPLSAPPQAKRGKR